MLKIRHLNDRGFFSNMVYLGFRVLTTYKEKFGGQIQLSIEGKIHWKCSVRKYMEDPVNKYMKFQKIDCVPFGVAC